MRTEPLSAEPPPAVVSPAPAAPPLIDLLLAGFPRARFLAEHYLRAPFAHQGGAESLATLASWEAIERILREPDPDVLVARRGQLAPASAPGDVRQARELSARGQTLVIRHAETRDPALGALARAFAADFAAPVNIHLYATPPGEHGFGWHYDAEEVFAIQCAGVKRYTLRKNTLHPWPLVETLPTDMGFEHEVTPIWECTLAPGDWLYMPSGTWHLARAESESLSLAVGLLPPAAIHIFDALRADLLRSIEWRQRLGLLGRAATESPEAARTRLAELLTVLGADLGRRLSDPRFQDRLLARLYDV
jgi:50S ribosomal protein L16 3-hydroxylase